MFVQVTNTITHEKVLGSKHVRKDTLSSVRCHLVLAISAIIGCQLFRLSP
jgi:hypothetical protein